MKYLASVKRSPVFKSPYKPEEWLGELTYNVDGEIISAQAAKMLYVIKATSGDEMNTKIDVSIIIAVLWIAGAFYDQSVYLLWAVDGLYHTYFFYCYQVGYIKYNKAPLVLFSGQVLLWRRDARGGLLNGTSRVGTASIST